MALCVQRELAILHLLHHPHVVHLRQVLQDTNHVYFVMDYVDGGELYHVLTEHGRLAETKAKHLFGQLASALIWCHSHHIWYGKAGKVVLEEKVEKFMLHNNSHRDLKPENLLLDKAQENLKVVDFGMATIQSPDWLLKTSCGYVVVVIIISHIMCLVSSYRYLVFRSPHYASPEIVRVSII